jgi:hypothetical protein
VIGTAIADRNTANPIYVLNADNVPCNGNGPSATKVHVTVTDPPNDPKTLHVTISFTAGGKAITGALTMGWTGKTFDVTLGPFSYRLGAAGSVEADVTAVDAAGNKATKHFFRLSWLDNCPIP